MDIQKIAEIVLAVIGGITTVIVAIRQLRQWLKPIRVEPSYQIFFGDDACPDEIGATIINRSNETQYIRNCYARGTYSFRHILLTHLRNPLVKPSLYPNIWYGSVVYNMMDDNPIKLELHELCKLVCKLHEHPLNAMDTPYFFIEVELTSDKRVRSKKIETPSRWKLIGSKKVASTFNFNINT